MNQSQQIGQLVAALAKAQSEFGAAFKESNNSAYTGSRYADLASIIGATRPALNKHGISVLQVNGSDLERQTASVETFLMCGEEWVSTGPVEAPATGRGEKFDVQSIGSAWTYLRRYTLQAILGIAAEEDDDGDSLDNNNKPIPKQKYTPEQALASKPTPQARAETAQQELQVEEGPFSIMGNRVTCIVKKVKEWPKTNTTNESQNVLFNGRVEGFNFATNWHKSLFGAFQAAEGKEVSFLFTLSKDKKWIQIDDVLSVDGVNYQEGKPVVEGDQQ